MRLVGLKSSSFMILCTPSVARPSESAHAHTTLRSPSFPSESRSSDVNASTCDLTPPHLPPLLISSPYGPNRKGTIDSDRSPMRPVATCHHSHVYCTPISHVQYLCPPEKADPPHTLRQPSLLLTQRRREVDQMIYQSENRAFRRSFPWAPVLPSKFALTSISLRRSSLARLPKILPSPLDSKAERHIRKPPMGVPGIPHIMGRSLPTRHQA